MVLKILIFLYKITTTFHEKPKKFFQNLVEKCKYLIKKLQGNLWKITQII